jgi:hypothetical protein
MSTRIDLLTPVGRLVQGSLYNGATTDAENRPLVYKTGPNMGQPRVNYWFSLAVPKGAEQHWNQTEWGAKIWNVGQAGFPNGAANSPHFAWKLIDGDSVIPNTQGNKPCDNEGFPGNWILKFSGSFAPSLFNENGTLPLTEPNAIQLGDYVQVYGYVEDNKSTQQPGVYLNHSMIARSGYGQRIIAGADPKSVGFGASPLPAGASTTPLASFAAPVVPVAPLATVPAVTPAAIAPAPVAVPPAYPQILTPPSPIAAKVLTEKANGASYEQLIAVGWTDALLIQQGMMVA